MRNLLGTLLSIVIVGTACGRQPDPPPPSPTASPSDRPADDGAAREQGPGDLPTVFDEAAARGLRLGDCAAGTGQHQMRGGPPPAPGTRVVPCEPTPQLYKHDPRRAKLLADFAKARKGERR